MAGHGHSFGRSIRTAALVCLVHVAGVGPLRCCEAAPLAYVSNSYSNSVWVIDTADGSVVAVVPVGVAPAGVAVRSDGERVYVVNQGDDSISVIDAATNRVSANISLPLVPPLAGVASRFSGRGRLSNAHGTKASVVRSSVIGLAGDEAPTSEATPTPTHHGPTPTSTLGATPTPTPKRIGAEPYGIAMNPAGTRVYVTSVGGISVVDGDAAEVIVSIRVPVASDAVSRLQGVAVSHDGSRIYAAVDYGYATSGTLAVLDADGPTVVDEVPVGLRPLGVAVSQDDSRVYVTNALDGTVSVIDARTATVVATVPVGPSPGGVAASTRSSRAYVASRGGYPPGEGSVAVIDGTLNQVVATIPIDAGALGVAVSPDDRRAFVVPSVTDTLSVIDLETNARVESVGIGRGSLMIGQFLGPPPDPRETPTPSPTPETPGEVAYVGNRVSRSLSVIDTATYRVINDVPLSGVSSDVVARPDGSSIYVGIDNQYVVTIKAGSLDLVASVPIDHGIFSLTVAPDGSRVYVGGYQAVSVIDTATNSIVARFPVRFGVNAIAVAPDGSEIYVTESRDLHFLDAGRGTMLATISFDYGVGHVSIAADAARLYVGGAAVLEGLTVVNSSRREVEATIPFFFTPGSVGPGQFEVSPDAASLYAVTYYIVYGRRQSSFRALTIIDADDEAIVGSIVPEVDPERIAFSRQTGFAYVTNSGANTVSVVDTINRRIVHTIPVRSSPYGIAVAPAPNGIQSPTVTIRPTRTPTPTPTQTPDLCPHDVTLVPDAGPPGTRVMLSGHCDALSGGYYASVGFGQYGIPQVRGDAEGNYATTFNVPSFAQPGSYVVSVYTGREIGSAVFTVASRPSPCPGDCDGNFRVTVDELVVGVDVLLGTKSPSACYALDTTHDGGVTINEVVFAVRFALEGCDPRALPPTMVRK